MGRIQARAARPRGPKCSVSWLVYGGLPSSVLRDLAKIRVFGAIFGEVLVFLTMSLRMDFRNSDIFSHFFCELFQMVSRKMACLVGEEEEEEGRIQARAARPRGPICPVFFY